MVQAQDQTKSLPARISTKERPKFPGGEEELKQFLSLNLKYPNEALQNKIEGEVVVSFKIDSDGRISDINTLKGLGYGCDEEAVRVVKQMPQWLPAKKDGKKIAVIYNLPIVFELPKQMSDESK